ncbi:MAG TPA: tRNA (adenosine(37)-N6)-threonylcarbamoyltransferase complex dimerization subunit type 1 TsaB [Planctomycetota bacterium]|jgi:tRNA threonylcarbamoyladenosine biosynthesis protein TsaB|nr:tRNA (adenosine(37)-N6)-threonylcarbamoyltransferase complex dimerization subunit type 1 TsaB [Planctomycetota bacterium]
MTGPRVSVALETSGPPGSAAAAAGGRVAEISLETSAAHGRDLLPALRECLARVGARPGEIDLVLVGTGPGSYTGLRVGIAAAKTIAFARGCPILALPSVEAIAAETPPGETLVAVAVDAKRGEVFASLHERTGAEPEEGERFEGRGAMRCRQSPRLLSLSALVRLAGGGTLVLGDGALLHARVLREAGLRVGDEALARPHAGILLRLGLRAFAARGGDLPESVKPLYLRPSAAEEKRAGGLPPPA